MKLILLRHGDAEEGNLDFERPLSLKGIRQLQGVAVALRPYFGPDDLMLYSPATRTTQSAQLILTRACPILHQGEMALYQQQSVSVLLELIASHLDVPTLWLVGHDPALSALLQQLTHTSLTLGKADYAILERNPDTQDFTLLTYQKAKGLKRCLTQRFSDEESMQRLLSLAMQCDVWATAWRSQSDDVECLHQWRVHMRRLESLLIWMKPAIAKKDLRPFSKQVHAMNQALATMRDLDRFLALNQAWLPQEVQHQLLAKRAGLQEKWLNTPIPKWAPLVQTLPMRHPTHSRNLAKAFDKRARAYQNDFHALRVDDAQAVHALRLQGKVLANWLELFPQLDHAWMPLQDVLKAQLKCMGELHDYECGKTFLKKGSPPALQAKTQHAKSIKALRRQLAYYRDSPVKQWNQIPLK